MEQVSLSAQVREQGKKEFCKKLRKAGKLPGVIYGVKNKPVALTMDYSEFFKMRMRTKDESSFLCLSISDSDNKVVEKQAIIKDIQVHPVTGRALHADFLEINMSDKVVVEVHLVFANEALARKQGGICEHHMRSVHIKALPTDIPDHIEIDLSTMVLGESLHVKDLSTLVPESVELDDDPEKTVVSLIALRGNKSETDEPEEEVAETE